MMTRSTIDRLTSELIAVLCVAAGALTLRLAHPPLGFFPGAFLAWPLLFEGMRRSRYPLAAGMAFGALYSMMHASWMMDTLLSHYGLGLPLALLFFTASAGIIPSLAYALFAAGVRGVIARRDESVSSLLLNGGQVAAAFTVCEWLRKTFSPEHGWGEVALSFAGVTEFFGIAPYTGAGGIAFATVFCGFLVWQSFRRFGKGDIQRGVIFIALAILTPGSLYFTGAVRQAFSRDEAASVIRLAVVHPGIRQSSRWRSDRNASTLAHYRRLSLEAFAVPVPGETERRLIVWPETAVTMALEGNPAFMETIADIARRTGAWILLGSPSFRGDGGNRRYYNSVYLIDPSGNIAGRYDKIYLLPFAERRFALVELMAEHDSGLYAPGGSITPLLMGEDAAGSVPLGAFICYEAGIPSLAGSLARRGARLFANISNDAWFGDSAESRQQITMLQLRCAEFGVPAVRSSGWGVAAVVDRIGRVTASTDIAGETVLDARIDVPRGGPSPYTRFQGWFEAACALFLLARFLRRKSAGNTVDEKPGESYASRE